MALPHLVKYIYNNGSDEVVRRGKKIHSLGYVEMIEHDELTGNIFFRIKDDNYSTFYKVNIQKFADPKHMNLRCSCPYNIGDICRHEAAALFRMQDMIDKNLLSSSAIQYNQQHSVAKMKFIDIKMLKMLSSTHIMQEAERMLRHGKANIVHAADERVEAEIQYHDSNFTVILQKNEEKNFDTSCNCAETDHPLCEHKVMLYLQLLNNDGPYYFDSIRNWDKEKNILLRSYGYSLQDDIIGKFEFTYKEGKPFLKVIDPSIKRVNAAPASNLFSPKPRPVFQPVQTVITPEENPVQEIITEEKNLRLGIVFNFNEKAYPFFSVDAIMGETDETGGNKKFIDKIERLDLGKFINSEPLIEDDRNALQQIRKLQQTEINKYLNRNSPFSGIWENIIHNEGDKLPEETRSLIAEYLLPKLKKITSLPDPLIYFLPSGKAFKTANLIELEVSNQFLSPVFKVAVKNNDFEINCVVKPEGQVASLEENECTHPFLFLYNDVLYIWAKPEDLLHAEKFLEKGFTKIKKDNWTETLQKNILPLTKEYQVEFDKALIKEVKSGNPDVKLILQEKGDHLVFQPVFSYKGFDTRPTDKATIILPDNDKILVIKRNEEAEKEFVEKLQNLHSQFSYHEDTGGLVLKGADVLRNNWFFLFIDAMKEMKVPVFGFEALKNFRFNTARPNTHIHVSSGLDWFDAKVEIEFGEQKVGIADIKKALAGKQSFVQLDDGTLGILPDEWLKKYALLFKVGEGKNDKLRLSKYHLSVIDDLYERRDEEEISFTLDAKYERLREFKNIPETVPPQEVAGILRPYQVAGFQWLNYLNDVGWGGILADDMGLGKTVQALSMIDHFKKTTGGLQSLVICPTTLIYNWQKEVLKFTPSLSCQIHHGNLRTRKHEELMQQNIIVTTYGTLRSDIQMLMKIPFDYIILDESQAIKNPSSKVTKAASLLNAKNRLCMSGTPLQNNTFDIFAQMNFLNPGLLGSMEFFRNEFATPIDKFSDLIQKDHLRKLLYPFILRRTKEQVAKDLPEKTETILFCEMEKEQRQIYDAYRNSYRDKILGSINDVGIDKSQLTILQGLMKLRQICDSPAILNEEDKYPNHSIKLDELTREITENIGEHKALIFSQFLGMLALIKEKLKEQNIKFEYFDGSTTPPERERAIENFQNSEECRVFLISLKAGGVGLNLTAADYVYIVDPWWNPAVEQQAIDRTHRIGQTKNIFAYRMICIDTIEDKILQLQERKRTLAKELIADDSTFVKSLTKADVEYLFS